MKKRIAAFVSGVLAAVFLAGGAGLAHAKDVYIADFETAYPAAAGSRLSSCSLCHTSVPTRNAYGAAWRTAGRNFTAIEGADSDGDGFSNIDEIRALTFPGNAADHPTVVDATAPTVTGFTIPTTTSSLTVPVVLFTATDSVGVTGYLINESSAKPAAGAAGWSATAPGSYLAASEGVHTLYAWAKDAAGNVSASLSRIVTITLPPNDTMAPTITSFLIPADFASLTVPVEAFAATDDFGVTGYLITLDSLAPDPGAGGWTALPPAAFTLPAAGTYTLHGWAKDAAGNVSTAATATVTVTAAPTPVLLFSDAFTDATRTGDRNWQVLTGAFGGVNRTFMALSTASNLAVVKGVTALAPFQGGRIETSVMFRQPLARTAAYVVFDLKTAGRLRYVRLNRQTRRLEIGQVGAYDGETAGTKAGKRLPALFSSTGRSQRLRVMLDSATGNVAVYVGAATTPAVSYTFPSTGIGRVGVAAISAARHVAFDNFRVWNH